MSARKPKNPDITLLRQKYNELNKGMSAVGYNSFTPRLLLMARAKIEQKTKAKFNGGDKLL